RPLASADRLPPSLRRFRLQLPCVFDLLREALRLGAGDEGFVVAAGAAKHAGRAVEVLRHAAAAHQMKAVHRAAPGVVPLAGLREGAGGAGVRLGRDRLAVGEAGGAIGAAGREAEAAGAQIERFEDDLVRLRLRFSTLQDESQRVAIAAVVGCAALGAAGEIAFAPAGDVTAVLVVLGYDVRRAVGGRE